MVRTLAFHVKSTGSSPVGVIFFSRVMKGYHGWLLTSSSGFESQLWSEYILSLEFVFIEHLLRVSSNGEGIWFPPRRCRFDSCHTHHHLALECEVVELPVSQAGD